MADLFITLVSIVPRPSTATTSGTKPGGSSTFTGTFSTNQGQQVQTPGGK